MKKHSYGKIIGMSWRWMSQILFRPFSLKKWIMLGIIILLAGQIGGGGGCNIDLHNKGGIGHFIDTIKEPPAPPGHLIEHPAGYAAEAGRASPDRAGIMLMLAAGGIIFLAIAAFLLLWMWVASNFSFVFLDSMIRNDASFRVPFHRNKPQGNSYFRWNIAFSLAFLAGLAVIIGLPVLRLARAGVFSGASSMNAGKVFSVIMPYAGLLAPFFILMLLVAFIAQDFVLPIMYKKKVGVRKAWGQFFGILAKNKGEILLYFLIKFGLWIISLAVAVILAIIGIIAVLAAAGLFGLAGWLIYTMIPAEAKAVTLGLLAVIGTPLFVYLCFLFIAAFVPIPVFFRIFSLNVLGSIDESLDCFAPKAPEEIAAEGDDGKFRKSMRLVWFTVLAPILFSIIGIAAAVSMPAFLKGKEEMKMAPFRKKGGSPAIPLLPERRSENAVTVYLKNGNNFEAVIENETKQNVAFRIKGGVYVYPRSDILRIEKKKEAE